MYTVNCTFELVKFMRYKLLKLTTLICLELFLFVIVIFLVGQIILRFNGKVKGIQYVTQIKKDDMVFDSSSNLKYFYEPKPNSVEKWNPQWLGYEVENTINSDGLNERYEYLVDKPDKTFRIVTIGDSFTYGQYVKTNENYSELLENRLNLQLHCDNLDTFEVINLGVPGYDTEYQVVRFLKRGIKYNPDIVLWLVNDGNFNQVMEVIFPLQGEKIKSGIPYFNQSTGNYDALIAAEKEFKKSYSDSAILSYNISILKKISEEYRGRILLISMWLDQQNIEAIDEFIRIRKNSHFTYYPDVFNTWQNETYHFFDGHPNVEGHRKIAENLFNYLRENYFSSC